MTKRIIVTCGPSFEPIDNVRRITNFSTGELGVRLAENLSGEGFDVLCFKGSGATWPAPNELCAVDSFDTNDDLLRLLRGAATGHDVGAIFHVVILTTV
jgi:phosphopantothenoylcysteine decarboxylase/phosphopantothenate--cysteine ligase